MSVVPQFLPIPNDFDMIFDVSEHLRPGNS